METNSIHNHLLSSLISDIKSYSGNDPLLPWLRGIKKMKESLPSNLLKEKMPRFLQKCTQTFYSDRRYRNDLRYLRVWLHLMDYVDEPKALLRTMEMNHIGKKRALFYQAYALYYEKMKIFDEAEKMYHLGVKNLAEPVDELQKSYEQFLHRMERYRNKKIQRQERTGGKPTFSAKNKENNAYSMETTSKKDSSYHNVKRLEESKQVGVLENSCLYISRRQGGQEKESKEPKMSCGDDTVVVKFVDTAIVGKSVAEDACHHGLVDPTINMKEAMNDINNMFREPLEIAPVSRRLNSRESKMEKDLNNGFYIFSDENLEIKSELLHQKEDKVATGMQYCKTFQEPLQIFVDDKEVCDYGERTDNDVKLEYDAAQNLVEWSHSSALDLNGFVFPCPKDEDSESSPRLKIREDTVVHRFVGTTISDEPVVENVCHHGLVDPTINLKEAMDDINNMFGEPIDYVQTKRSKKQDKTPARKQDFSGFSILPDDDAEHKQEEVQPPEKSGRRDKDLFEPTVFTKEAMDEINKMFGMPLDF
ncbi:hypothetical protein K2173_002959 [Erythroxylum novogranatense]|uniref:BUB1 N-terminal domain-containing protein n=1 Tax=Erythroxylum novogranatense TaxID=1862640 RepID=A0AAV8TU84_9ROSI|nr:hypothetical protein K2173_002959 [Erythroxylum novogranatense]